MKYDKENIAERILQRKGHIVRAINQEKSKIDLLDNLTVEQILVVMDWAMKWLPQSYRDSEGVVWQKGYQLACVSLQKKMNLSFRYLPFYVCKSGF